MSEDLLTRAREAAERINPGVEAALRARYDALLPGFAETLVETTFGRFYARDGVDAKTRSLATVAALTALGGQTAPQLRIHVAGARRAGASRREIAEIIHQMALYGGYPAMINALNAAIEVFDAEDEENCS